MHWRGWRLPGPHPQPYALFVDAAGMVWLSDFGSDAMVRFDPASETFAAVALPSSNAAIRQLAGRPGEVWGAESGTDKLEEIKREKFQNQELTRVRVLGE